MSQIFALGQATTTLSRLVSAVRDDQLELPTPCSEWTVADLLAHIHQFASVFTTNAAKQPPNPPETLVADWRTAIPRALDELAAAWQDESAWQGTVSAGGVEMDAADNAVVAAEELSLHAWDLARATGQELDLDDASLDRVDTFFDRFGSSAWGEQAEAPTDATRAERAVARAGRDPRWIAPR